MKVISIDRDKDRKIFEAGDPARERMIAYGAQMEELHMVFFVLKKYGLQTIAIAPNVFIYPTNSTSRWLFLWDAIVLGKKIVRENKFIRGSAVVTAQDPFECGFVAWRISKYFRIPLQLQVHTDFLSQYFQTSLLQKMRVWMAKFLIPRATMVRVVSVRIAESFKNAGLIPKQPVKILPIRIDVESVMSGEQSQEHTDLKKKFPQFKFIVLMASRLTSEKRVGDAITAFARQASHYPYLGLIIAGKGSEREHLQRLAKQIGIDDKVIFLGFRRDVLSLMKSADMFLSTSEYEGYGMSLVEAGLHRLPVVCTDVGLSGELLIHKKNAYVCPVGDVECISSGIGALLGNNALRIDLGRTLYADIVQRIPTKETYVSSYIALLEEASRENTQQ